MFPSEEDFQQLIDICNVNRFISPEIDMNDVENSVINSLSLFMTLRQRVFKDNFKVLPAFIWMSQKNSAGYNKAMDCLFKNDYDAKTYTDKVLGSYRNRLENGALFRLAVERLGYAVVHAANDVQKKEKYLGHIAGCFMSFLYPSKKLTPAEFKQDIRAGIEALEKSKECFHKLQKYEEIFYGYKLSKQHDFIEYHLTTLKSFEEGYIFPAKKINEQYATRMFIVNLIRPLLMENRPTKDVLEFIMELMSFDCFENPITEVNVRKIINGEKDRKNRAERIDKFENIKKKDDYEKGGLDFLLSNKSFFE